jgi:hypothetical protein
MDVFLSYVEHAPITNTIPIAYQGDAFPFGEKLGMRGVLSVAMFQIF